MEIKFTKNITKLGSSLYFNIPNFIIKKYDLKEGEIVDVILIKNKRD